MLKLFSLICLLLLIRASALAQNWEPFTLGETHHFRSDTANFPDRSVRIDSIRGNAVDSIWHFNRLWKTLGFGDSAYIDQPNFSLRSLRVKANGLFQLFDPGNIALYCWADSGETWLIDSIQNLTATVSRVYFDSVLGEPDSLKLIFLTGGDSLLLSKDHGLVQWPAVLGPQAYSLVGIQERRLGDTLPGFDGFFRYRPGSEYYWRSYWYQQDNPGFTRYEWETKMVIDSVRRDSTGMEVSYSAVQRTYYQGSSVGFGSTFTARFHLADTANGLVERTNGEAVNFEYCLVPYNFRRQCFDAGPGVYLNSQWTGTGIWTSTVVSRVNDTTFLKLGPNLGNQVWVYSEIGPSLVGYQPLWIQQEAEFTEGLGVTYVNWQDFETTAYYRLVGHIIEGDTLGTIWTDSMLLGNQMASPATDWQVFPNPATERAMIRMNPPSSALVRLFSVSGQLVLETEFEGGVCVLDLGHLAKGLYLLQLTSAGRTDYQKLVVRE